MAEKGEVLKTMDELELLVDVDGLMKKGVYITSYGSYDALVEEYSEQGWEGEALYGLFEEKGVDAAYERGLLSVDDPFITIDDSNSSDGVTVYPYYDSSEEIVGSLKVDYKEFVIHDSMFDYHLDEVESFLENEAIDFTRNVEESKFTSVDLDRGLTIIIEDEFLYLAEFDGYDHTKEVGFNDLEQLKESIKERFIFPRKENELEI